MISDREFAEVHRRNARKRWTRAHPFLAFARRQGPNALCFAGLTLVFWAATR